MQKILIFENEELFKALQQVKEFLPECEILQTADIYDDIVPVAGIVIINSGILKEKIAGKTHYIILSDDIKAEGMPVGATLVKKPYRLKEIIDVIQVLLLSSATNVEFVPIGNFEFDRSTRTLLKDAVEINLTEKESELINLLNEAHGEVVSRDEILKKVWEYEVGVDTHTIETHIYRIRQKLGKENDFIGSMAAGYFIKDNP